MRECSSYCVGVLPYCGGPTALHGFAEYLKLHMRVLTSKEQQAAAREGSEGVQLAWRWCIPHRQWGCATARL